MYPNETYILELKKRGELFPYTITLYEKKGFPELAILNAKGIALKNEADILSLKVQNPYTLVFRDVKIK